MGSDKSFWIRHSLEGGWATDYGPTVDVAPGADGVVPIPFLTDIENADYVFPRGAKKIGGTEQVQASVLGSSTTTVTGLVDYWRQGTSGTPTRRRVAHAGTAIYADTDDNNYATTLASGLESGAIPHYSTFDDLLIIGSSSTVDVPRSWDQTTFQNLAGSPPRFSFSVKHRNRQFAAGVYTAPSTLYYSVSVDPENWTGGGSGSINIDPNDGDMITGIASFRGELLVFKGPYKGSIHRVQGSSASDFVVVPLMSGLGAVWQNSIVPFGNDLCFMWSTGTVHSLLSTQEFGDYVQAFLTRPIDSWIKDNLNKNRLKFTWGVNDTVRNRILFGTSRNAVQSNDVLLTYDYRFKDSPFGQGRWSKRTSVPASSLGYFVDGGGSDRRVYAGGTTGVIRRLDVATQSVDGSTAYTARLTTPTLTYGTPWMEKTLAGLGVGMAPKGNYNATMGWSRNGGTQQTATVSMQGGDVLG